MTSIHTLSVYRRPVIVAASILIMCCSGSVYAWSIFVAPLRAGFHFSSVQPQIVFGFIIAAFTVTMLFVGRIERKTGPRITAIIGAVLFSSGYLLASFSGGNFILILLGIGILSGSGMGFGYVTVLVNIVRWFPGRRGLAAGIVVAGFAGGALLLSLIAQPILDSGVYILDVFRIVAIVYGVLFLLAALFMSSPGLSGDKPPERPVGVRVLVKDRRFWVLFYTFFAGSFSGLLLIGNLKPLGVFYGVSENATLTAVVLLSIGNAAGRILWGQVYDKAGGRRSVLMALALLSFFFLLLIPGVRSDFAFLALAFIIGSCFGANFVLYAADVTHIYGIDQLGIIYPVVSLAYGIAGIVGPVVGGYIFDISGSYYPSIVLSAIICLTGLAVYTLTMRKSRAPKEKPAVCFGE